MGRKRARTPGGRSDRGAATRPGGVTPVEVRHRPAVKTRSRGLSPRGAGRAVGGIRARAENSGRRASSCSTVLLSRASVCADVKAVVRELLGSAVQGGCRPTANGHGVGGCCREMESSSANCRCMTARPFLFVCIPGGRDRGARRRDRLLPPRRELSVPSDLRVGRRGRRRAGDRGQPGVRRRDPAVQHRRPLT
jgi:hypothetical protein